MGSEAALKSAFELNNGYTRETPLLLVKGGVSPSGKRPRTNQKVNNINIRANAYTAKCFVDICAFKATM